MSGTKGRAPAPSTNLLGAELLAVDLEHLVVDEGTVAPENGDVLAVLGPVALAAGSDRVDPAEHAVDDGRPVHAVEAGVDP